MPDPLTIPAPVVLMFDRAGLAAALSISTTTADRWLSEGFLPAPTISRGSKIRLWSADVIRAWIAEQGEQGKSSLRISG